MKISVLHLGRLEFLKKHLVSCDSETEKIQCLIPAILIEHPTLGNVLYDTGNSPFYYSEYSQEILDNYPVTEFISIEQALAEKGLKPTDIDVLILSHLHFDHAGGLKYFVGTKAIRNVVVAEGDLKDAFYHVMTGDEGAYCKSLFDIEGIRFRAINEEVALADDFILLLQQCHTPGVIGLILKTQTNGNIIVTSDTIYTRESFEKSIPPGGNNSKSQKDFFVNLDYIKKLQREYQATLFFGHDEQQIKEWSKNGCIE